MEIAKRIHPQEIGLFSNIGLGNIWFPTEITPQMEGWTSVWKDLSKTFFRQVKTPYVVYFGVGSISWLESEYALMNPKNIRECNKKGLKIYLWEPLSTYNMLDEDDKEGIYTSWSDTDLGNIRAYELDSIQYYAQINGLTNVQVYSPSYNSKLFFQDIYPELQIDCTPVGWIYPATINVQEQEGYMDADKIIKKFWCGNWRYASHRHCVASYLVQKTESYNLSWLYESNAEILEQNSTFNLPNKDDLYRGAAILDTMAPLSMDIDVDKKLNKNEYIDIHIDTNPKNAYAECFCAIVNETRYAEPTGLLTEKIMNAMLNYRPVIMVGPPGNLEYMRAWGFMTFDEWFDESYDLEKDHSKRMQKIFSLIDWINSKSIDELKEIYEDMNHVLLHNKTWIEELQVRLLEKPITKNNLFKRIRYAD